MALAPGARGVAVVHTFDFSLSTAILSLCQNTEVGLVLPTRIAGYRKPHFPGFGNDDGKILSGLGASGIVNWSR